MGAIRMFEFTKSELEEHDDMVKKCVLAALTKEEIIDYDVADEWANTHTVIIRKKGIFRTISSLWKNEEESPSGFYNMIVKRV